MKRALKTATLAAAALCLFTLPGGPAMAVQIASITGHFHLDPNPANGSTITYSINLDAPAEGVTFVSFSIPEFLAGDIYTGSAPSISENPTPTVFGAGLHSGSAGAYLNGFATILNGNSSASYGFTSSLRNFTTAIAAANLGPTTVLSEIPIPFAGAPGPGGGAVPEPASWALMIAGFGLTGAALRKANRRRHTKVRLTYT